MNRRSFLAMLGLSPIAAVLPDVAEGTVLIGIDLGGRDDMVGVAVYENGGRVSARQMYLAYCTWAEKVDQALGARLRQAIGDAA